MLEYYRRMIAAALGEPIIEGTNTLFSVIEYTLGKKERVALEEKISSRWTPEKRRQIKWISTKKHNNDQPEISKC